MFGNRKNFEDKKAVGNTDARLRIESLLYLRENEPEKFEEAKQKLQGTDLWNHFQKEYGKNASKN